MIFRADLHCHTTCSDGSLSPKEIIDHAAEKGLRGLSITDHDTIGAFDIAVERAREKNILLLPGIEFSTSYKDVSIHVLGYAFDVHSESLLVHCQKLLEERCRRNSRVLGLLRKKGLIVHEEELLSMAGIEGEEVPTALGRLHIAQLLLKKGYVHSVQEAFNKYIGDERSCYEVGSRQSVEEAIVKIQKGGGKAILAHPHLIQRKKILQDLLKMNFDGLEVYYARFSREKEQKWLDIARQKQWIVTGGSDFHGLTKPHIGLGCSWVSEEIFMKLYDNFLIVNGKG